MTHVIEIIAGTKKVRYKPCNSITRDIEYGSAEVKTFGAEQEIIGMFVPLSANAYSKLLEQDEGAHEYAKITLLVPMDTDLPLNSIVYDNFFTNITYELIGIIDKIKHYYEPIEDMANYREYILRKYKGSETFA
jgi:hypothetical protein